MGYRTSYTLEIQPQLPLLHPVFDIRVDGDYMTLEDLCEGWSEETTWYEHDEEMLEISRQYPDLVFVLDGNGEYTDDIWRSFYKNGRMYTWVLDYELPKFDESKLEDMDE